MKVSQSVIEKTTSLFSIICIGALISGPIARGQVEAPNVADPLGGRENHRYTDRPLNEFRLYNFYSGQTDYYLVENEVPEIIPTYPDHWKIMRGYFIVY